MDISEKATVNIISASPTEITGGKAFDAEDIKRRKVARDFEAVFMHQILKSMQDTIGEEESEDVSSGQIKSMYWSFLADAVAQEGGLGLWEDIYNSMPQTQGENLPSMILDEKA